jgi:hypothetical protein
MGRREEEIRSICIGKGKIGGGRRGRINGNRRVVEEGQNRGMGREGTSS